MASSNKLLIKSFNDLFIEFIKKLSLLMPENEKIKEYLKKYRVLSAVKETYFIKWYLKYIEPHEQYIYEDNISYFITEYDVEKTVNNHDEFNNAQKETTLSNILNCKEAWVNGEITDTTKESICNYIKTLYFIAKNYKK